MTKLEQMIKEFCPNGVETYKLKEVCNEFIVPMRDKPKKFDGSIPWCRIEDKEGNYFHRSKSNQCVSETTVSEMNLKIFPVGTVICSCSASIGSYAINTQPLITNQTFIGIVCGDKIFNEYLRYYMETQTKTLIYLSNKGTIPYISRKKFEELSIPVPPLPVQKEIVHILDDLTEKTGKLIAELKTEIDERKKQYIQYKQLTFNGIDNCTTKHITDIAQIKARVGWQRLTRGEYLSSGEYCLITGTDFLLDGRINFDSCVYVTKERFDMDENIQIHKNDILITKDGTLGKVAIILEEPQKPATLNSGVFRIKITDSQISAKYMYHFFTSKYFTDFVESVKTGSTVPHLTQQGLVTLDIPIPSLEEQNQIVSKLDTLNQVYTKIIEELSFEIETRKKQYEYYRDKLLSFNCV